MRGVLGAIVAIAALGCACGADAQILQRFGIGREDAPESVLARVRAGEFNERCMATVEGTAAEEPSTQTEQTAQQPRDIYNLFDLLPGAPSAARHNVSTISSAHMDPAFQAIGARIMAVQPPPPGIDVNLRIAVQSADDIDARQVSPGAILLSVGLLTALRNRVGDISDQQIGNEFAFVIAHEYAHVLMCHYNRPLAQERSRQSFRSMSTIGLLIAVLTNSTMTRTASGVVVDTDEDADDDILALLAATTLLSEFNSSVINPAWSREQERDADRLAVELMHEADLSASFAPGLINDLFNADRTANERFREIAGSVPPQALGALLLSLNERNTGQSLEARLSMIALSAGLQAFQQWRINQRRHFHENAERRGQRIAEMDQFAGRNNAPAGAVAAGVFDDHGGDAFAAAQGAVLRAGFSADLIAPDLARQASQAIMAGDFETGCARAAEALRAGPQLIDALMVSGQCELHREDKVTAARRFEDALRLARATPDDFMTVAGIWSQLAERSRAEDALAAGGRRFGPDRFYVERINIAGEFDDLTAVRAITGECQGSQIPEVRENCTRRQSQLINDAAEEAQQAETSEGNPLSSLLRSGQSALGRLTGGDERPEDPSAAQEQQEQEQSPGPPPGGGP